MVWWHEFVNRLHAIMYNSTTKTTTNNYFRDDWIMHNLQNHTWKITWLQPEKDPTPPHDSPEEALLSPAAPEEDTIEEPEGESEDNYNGEGRIDLLLLCWLPCADIGKCFSFGKTDSFLGTCMTCIARTTACAASCNVSLSDFLSLSVRLQGCFEYNYC